MRNRIFNLQSKRLLAMCLGLLLVNIVAYSQSATVTVPVGIGNPCNNTSRDSLKFYNYNDVTNVLTHRSNCLPNLATPGFSDNLSTVQFNPYDGYLYYGRITSSAGQYTTTMYRWFPTSCPNGAALASYQVFQNQLVVGIEFDPSTGLGYQINFVDTTGVPALGYDVPNTVGQYLSAAIVNGRPASAHYDATNGDLRYSRANDDQGVSWTTPIIISSSTTNNVGQFASLSVVNGNPAISYYNATSGDLEFVRANDANGTTWGSPIIVDAGGNVGQYTSLVVVNGNPAIAYYDVTGRDLKYVIATNANGTAWSAPLTLDAGGFVGTYISMAVVNGNPAISYYDDSNDDLKYIRSTNSTGSTWGTPIAVATPGNTGQYTSLAVVNGNPAISFYDASSQDLNYVRATDVNGSTWGSAQSLITGGDVGLYTSLAIVNGNPAISYYDNSNGDLQYLRANDANGTSWAAEATPEATNNVGQFSNLVVAGGNPAIAYYDVTSSAARFIRAYDNIGRIWFRNTGVYNMEMQQVNFATNTLGPSIPINFGSRYIYRQSGDVVMTPGRQMLAAFDNKYFTINWQDYNVNPLVATFIDTLRLGAGNNMVGLAYASGNLVGSVRSGTICSSFHREIDIITGALSPITATDNFTSADMTNIPTGLGMAKRLVSATLVSPGTYDVVYELVIRNYGGTPIASVQAYDTLNNINGVGNNVSGSITSFSGPAGFNPNPSYDGKTAGNFSLLVPGSTLSNIPGQNTITIGITCRVSGISPGIVYNNSASVYGNNIFGDNLRDQSTNGSTPDLNSNDKPDDPGENQPTPLLITVPAITPPCLAMSTVLYSQNFGSGTTSTIGIPAPVVASGVSFPTGTSGYTGSTTQPLALERFMLINNANAANNSHFLSMTDHTGNADGRMLAVNADASNSNLYRGAFVYSTCGNSQYSLSFYAAFPGNANYQTLCNAFGGYHYPRLKMRIKDGISGLIITESTTPDITTATWQQYGLKFTTPTAYNQIIIEIMNDAAGGCGNDILLDDIQFGSCDPLPTVSANVAAGCIGQSANFTSNIADPGALTGSPVYQWQVFNAGTGVWQNIAGATSANYSIASVAASDTGKQFRVLIAAPGNMINPNCRYSSPAMLLSGRTYSAAAATATRNKNNVCGGIDVTLGTTGGTLGSLAAWTWYEGSCATGSPIGTGTTFNVTPNTNTTYYVRAEGVCNTTSCVAVSVFISCDIDKDNDGIPDYIESYIPASWADANVDGISNAFDLAYPGFVDYNNDHINDDFQADGDSDNDGISNYLDTNFPGRVDVNSDGIDDRFDTDLDGIINMLDLDSDNDGITDVVEAGGVDANGDGLIDNYTDTDNDGLSQNVDANNSGARISGVGLSALDLDRDGIPNAVDRDSDNDGIPDVVEAGGLDTNNNAVIDGFVDLNNDGLHDSYILTSALLLTGSDGNTDGRADSYPFKNFDTDGRANPYDLDSDGDGLLDVREAGFDDSNYNGIIDGTFDSYGWSNTVNAMATLNLPNTDGIGNPNWLDIDSDGDGIPDNIEGQSTYTYKLPTGSDSDNDGLDNAYDLAPHASSFGGAGILIQDLDVDGIPDYMDLDTDSDGQTDIVEGHDLNFNGIVDDNVTPSGIDVDGDGLDDHFDALISTTDRKGTSGYMGLNGSATGDILPGSITTVQRTLLATGGCPFERDWRCVQLVLPVRYLLLSSTDNGKGKVSLNWDIICDQPIDLFEIERSTDNVNFKKVGEKTADLIRLNQMEHLAAIDDITGITEPVIFYRIKVIAKDGRLAYSNIVLVRKAKAGGEFSVYPNPADDKVNIRYLAEKDAAATIQIFDAVGKIVKTQNVNLVKGMNNVALANLQTCSNGIYQLRLLIDSKVHTSKLIIQR